MGEHVTRVAAEDRTRFRARLQQCQDVLVRLLDAGRFETGRRSMGLELELNLVDGRGFPVMLNDVLLARIASPEFQTELGMFNIEANLVPRHLGGTVLTQLATDLRSTLTYATERAVELDARIVMIGMLPTLTADDVTMGNLTPSPRFALLNEAILASRGEDVELDIRGVEQLHARFGSIAVEAAATSCQLHLMVEPDTFAATWNAAQAVAGVQLALAANSPFFLQRELWRESRIPVCTQATDFRPVELANQGVRPRMWFGERWATDPADMFEENLRLFPALLPLLGEEDPVAVLAAGGVPQLSELKLHNGTVYRWNRPVYDVSRGRPHLRVENRVLPAGPSIPDVVADAAFFYGVVRALAGQEVPVWSGMSFAAAEANFLAGATHGIGAEQWWPSTGSVPATRLVLDVLLPLAAQGLDDLGIDPRDRDRYLDVVQARAAAGTNGAQWQARTFHRRYDGTGTDRLAALAATVVAYEELMQGGDPVHAWPVG